MNGVSNSSAVGDVGNARNANKLNNANSSISQSKPDIESSSNAASNDSSAIADNPTPLRIGKSCDNVATGPKLNQPSASHSTNGSAEPDITDSQNNQTPDTLTRQEQARLHSLKAMLNVSNARYEKANRNRTPKFSAGLEIMIVSGDHTGKIGMVLDADYIANRALISLSDQESPHWISFRSLGHAD